MGRVCRPIVSQALPEGAELPTRNGQRFARWKTKRWLDIHCLRQALTH